MSDSSLHDATFPVGRVTTAAIGWRFKGELRITAILKATFAFAPDGAMTRAEPQPIFREEVQHGRGPARSVRFTSDWVPYRRRADVLFTGHAHAPPGGPVESMTVRLALSDGSRFILDRSLLVRRRGGFQTIPLTYEHAFGGIGFPDNPYGEGFPEGEGEEPSIVDPADPKRPACFAPIGQGVMPRRRLLGSSPRPSFEGGVAQVTEDLDWDYFQAAPADQRTDFLRGDEWILLEGLHPALARLQMRLPGARGVGRIHGLGGSGVQEGRLLAMHADTLHISGDEQRCTLTWRGTFPLASEAALGAVRIALGVELPGEPVVWPDASALKRAGAPAPRVAPAPASTETLPLSDSDIEVLSRREVEQTLPVPSGAAARSPGLPFHSGPAVVVQELPRAEPAARPAARREEAGETLPIPSRGAAPPPALPFQQDAAEAPAPIEEPPAPAAPKPAPGASPWAPPPPEPAPEPRPPPAAKPPPKVNIRSKLYGFDKKGR